MAARGKSRRLLFEALESRIALSAGMAHPEVAAAVQHVRPVTGAFHGTVSLLQGTNVLLIGGLNGTLGKAPFQGFVNANVSGGRFLGGELHLVSAQGTLLARLGPGNLARTGKMKVVVVFDQGTGGFTSVAGSAGYVEFRFTTKPAARPAGRPSSEGDFGEWQRYENAFVSLIVTLISIELQRVEPLLHPPR